MFQVSAALFPLPHVLRSRKAIVTSMSQLKSCKAGNLGSGQDVRSTGNVAGAGGSTPTAKSTVGGVFETRQDGSHPSFRDVIELGLISKISWNLLRKTYCDSAIPEEASLCSDNK
jgi:hypothetical protein